MADNVSLNIGIGGDTIAADEVAGVKHQRVKLEWGADGVINEVDDASGKRLPVKIAEALPAGTNNIGDVDIASALPAGTNNIGDVDIASAIPAGSNKIGAIDLDSDATLGSVVPAAAQYVAGTDGTNARGLKTDANGELQVDIVTLPTISAQGDIAHDSPDSTSNPQKMGGKAIAHGTNPTAVAADDRTNWYFNRHGIPFILSGHPNTKSFEYNTTGAQTDDPILAVISSGTKIVITCITVTLSNATTVNVSVRIGFGTSTLTAEGASGADGVGGIVLSHPGIAPGSGMVKGNGGGLIGIGGDGEELRITCGAPTTGKLTVQVDYYTIES